MVWAKYKKCSIFFLQDHEHQFVHHNKKYGVGMVVKIVQSPWVFLKE